MENITNNGLETQRSSILKICRTRERTFFRGDTAGTFLPAPGNSFLCRYLRRYCKFCRYFAAKCRHSVRRSPVFVFLRYRLRWSPVLSNLPVFPVSTGTVVYGGKNRHRYFPRTPCPEIFFVLRSIVHMCRCRTLKRERKYAAPCAQTFAGTEYPNILDEGTSNIRVNSPTTLQVGMGIG